MKKPLTLLSGVAFGGIASDTTVNCIKEEPVKAVLIAAATGAALMALVSLVSAGWRTGHDG